MRATVTYEPDIEAAMDAWFDRWEPELTAVSDNLGCGCCVHAFEIEGPTEAFAALPPDASLDPEEV